MNHPNTGHLTWLEAAQRMENLAKEQGEEAFTDPEQIPLLETLHDLAPTEQFKSIAAECLRTAKLNRVRAKMKAIEEQYGRDALHSGEHFPLFAEMMDLVPQSFLDEAAKVAKDMGLMPDATHVDTNGRPVYSLKQVSEKLGVPVQELEECLQSRPDADWLMHRGPVSPLQ